MKTVLALVSFLIPLSLSAAFSPQRVALLNAAESGNCDEIRNLNISGNALDICNEFGTPALVIASRSGHEDAALLILSLGADAKITDSAGDSAVHAAASKNQKRLIRALLSRGVSIDSKNNFGKTPYDEWLPPTINKSPLYWALFLDNAELLKTALSKSQPSMHANQPPDISLYAAQNNSSAAFAYLYQNGLCGEIFSSDLDDDNFSDKSDIFSTALTSGSDAVVSFILAQSEANTPNHRLYRYSVKAVSGNNESIVRKILSYGFPVNPPANEEEQTDNELLYYAQSATIAEILAANGAHINADIFSHSPIFEAVAENRTEVVRFLVKQKARLSSEDLTDTTLLHLAARADNAQLIDLLIKAGAPYRNEIRNNKKVSPLQSAVANGCANATRYFIEQKIDASITEDLLCSALESASVDTARYLYNNGARVDATRHNGKTMLHFAAASYNYRKDYDALFSWILSCAVNINEQDNEGNSALYYAAQNSSKLVNLLLKNGADASIKNKNGETPLFAAVQFNQTYTIKLLVQKGCSITATNNDGENLLRIAQKKKGYIDQLIPLLLQYGVNANVPDKKGVTVVDAAFAQDDERALQLLRNNGVKNAKLHSARYANLQLRTILEDRSMSFADPRLTRLIENLLKEGANVNAQNDDGETLLHCIITNYEPVPNEKKLLEKLLKKGADPLLQNKAGETAFKIAVEQNDLAALSALFKAITGNDFNVKTPALSLQTAFQKKQLVKSDIIPEKIYIEKRWNTRETVLTRCISTSAFIYAELLCANGYDVNHAASDGLTPLMYAAGAEEKLNRDSASQWTAFFLAKGADANKSNNDGITPLMYAARTGNTAAAELLISHGAKINTQDSSGYTALMWACKYDNSTTAKLLIDCGADTTTRGKDLSYAYLHALARECAPTISLLSNTSISLSGEDSKLLKNLQLLEAVKNGDYRKTVLLIKSGADVNYTAQYGMTPLHYALVKWDNDKIQKYLIERGADVNAATDNALTPLMFAIIHCGNKTIQLIVNKGARANDRDKWGHSAVVYAMKGYDRSKVLKILYEHGALFESKTESGVPYIFFASGSFIDFFDRLQNSGKKVSINLNATDPFGRTALLFASYAHDESIVEWLIKNGANITHKDLKGRNAVDYALSANAGRTLKILNDSGLNLPEDAYILSGDQFLNSHEYAQAVEQYEIALKLNGNADLFPNYLIALNQLGKKEEAYNAGKTATEKRSNDVKLNYVMAQICAQNGRTNEALNYFSRAVAKGFRAKRSAWTNPDLAKLRSSKKFKALCGIK